MNVQCCWWNCKYSVCWNGPTVYVKWSLFYSPVSSHDTFHLILLRWFIISRHYEHPWAGLVWLHEADLYVRVCVCTSDAPWLHSLYMCKIHIHRGTYNLKTCGQRSLLPIFRGEPLDNNTFDLRERSCHNDKHMYSVPQSWTYKCGHYHAQHYTCMKKQTRDLVSIEPNTFILKTSPHLHPLQHPRIHVV